MKIGSSPQNYVNQSYANAAKANTAGSKAKPAAGEQTAQDSINLSATTRDLQKIAAASETDPQGRAQMVQDLKAQVQANQYTVNAEQVAEKMIGSIMDELG